jgi:hypothetical protein
MYLKADVLPDDPLTVRQRFWVAYNSASKLMVQWLGSLPEPERHIYQKFTLPPVSRLFVEGLTREKEVTQRQQRIRKAETDAVVPRFAAIRAEAHFRYNRIARLRQAYHQALRALSWKGQDFPVAFSYEEGGDRELGIPTRERLWFRIWDRRSFVQAHADAYSRSPVVAARCGTAHFADDSKLFLEFVRAERLMVKVAQMLGEHYQLQPREALPGVEFNAGSSRAHRFAKAPYLFQYAGRHLSHNAITACMRFLLHGMVFRTREGKLVVLKARLLRHAFATHAVQVEKIPIDIVGPWLHQKNLTITDYYSQPTESMVAEASALFLSRVAAQINVSEAVLRSPEELQRLYEEAQGKAGTLADVIGGQCVSHGYCAAKFACVGCAGKVPDPAKRNQIEKHKQWASLQVDYATQEVLTSRG